MIDRQHSGTLGNEREELALIQRRFRFVVTVMLAIFLVLGWRFGTLQLGEHERYAARADENRIRLNAVAPNRGLILDRNGRVLAENRPAYRLAIVPERTEGLEETVERLSELVTISAEEQRRFQRQRMRQRRFESVTLKSNLSDEEVARLAVHRHQIPGVEIEPYLTRHYPHGELLSHVVGYVGRIDERDLRRLGREQYRATSHVGKTGIERHYEHLLHGQPGLERVETNAQGRVLRVIERQDPVPGEDLQLTLDLQLQDAAHEALGDYAGAVVVLDVHNGEVLALVSKPGFDPNLFVHGISQFDYSSLLHHHQRPLFNRFLAGGYEPGSTIKPFIALAGLETGAITPQTRVFSRGWFQLPGHSRRYRDWRRGGHGWVDLELALAESVNVYFYQLAVDLGIDRISRELALFGLGRATGLDLPGELTGVLPTRSWKRATFGEPWYPGETVITGIGQGFTVVTPMQLAHATAALAGRGQTAPPWLVVPTEPTRMVEHADADWAAVFSGLEAVVHGPSGTARAIAADVPVRLAGKTGTSQVFGRPGEAEGVDEREQDELPEHLRNHALFTAFAPFDDPQIAVVVVAEHGGGGARVAAPAAGKVIKAAAELGLMDKGEAP
ncbi:penicillin-binding protein 2 [Wenzhouxiangella sp. AB-CW3]|uniref:penicillin-binding protein 2 n=1 Tax=Wenzhouxiangella sp. AB-CW3 TaxID=2771012 RepID=UPI00168B1406|nr:penicillin-binding protein 2 [Wenzhouxiangella sp. AB-CW3]QOC22794.1 penicillin-binding protein 2 [Wenzhouxiangella sp. AB-CW3]